jgi:endonuclease/exonuclease/phosphatase family metal-dependent hydrolase
LLWFRWTVRVVVASALALAGVYLYWPSGDIHDISGERAAAKAPTLRVMTYNVRVATPSDGDNDWPFRKSAVALLIRHHQPDVFGLQECYFSMARDLERLLPEYGWYARGSSDGTEEGAANPIFYRKSRLALVDSRTLWCSETPQTPSQGWGAQFPRVVTFVTLRDLGGEAWHFANLHLDHRGENSKRNSARLVAEQLKGREHAVVLGDFNSRIDGEATTELIGAGFVDAQAISATGHTGLENTFNGFRRNWTRFRKIDHILVSKDVRVERHEIPGDTIEGRIPSDHFPVLADLSP